MLGKMRLALLSILHRLGFYALLVCCISSISFAALIMQENISISLSGPSGDTILDYACVAKECDDIDGEFFDGESSVYVSLGSSAFSSSAGLVRAFSSSSSSIGDGFEGSERDVADAQALFGDTLFITGRPGSGFLEFIVSYSSQSGDADSPQSTMKLGTKEYSFSLESFEKEVFQIPFRFGDPVEIALSAFSTVGLPCCGNSMFAEAELSLQSIYVLDEQKRLIESNLRYTSGSDYTYAVYGTGPTEEPIPEGSTSLLCGTGLLGLLIAATRRKR